MADPAPDKPEFAPGTFGDQADNTNRRIYAKGSFGKQAANTGKSPGTATDTPSIPDVNPADRAVEALHKNAASMSVTHPHIPVVNREHEFDGRILKLEDLVTGILGALNGATITAVCHMDSTITITLTLPALPS